jgi:tetratricopeptide (TPR) repeat protein
MSIIDLDALWDFADPALSEQRFREALANSYGDQAIILQTQIARTYGLRDDMATAQAMLQKLEPFLDDAGAAARAHQALEYGRTFVSARHDPKQQTDLSRAAARSAYMRAYTIAVTGQLDDLAIDALHMMACIDTAPADQLHWGMQALIIAEQSSQPGARRWEGSLRNNIGYALHQLGRYHEALDQFLLAVRFREQQGKAEPLRIAYWMVAWTLRALERYQEALVIQRRLELECEAAGTADPYVFEELALLYAALGDSARAAAYTAKRQDAG